MIDGSLIVIAVGAYVAYRLACWIDPTIRNKPEQGEQQNG